jgi:phytoene dehydrogenase-like protein
VLADAPAEPGLPARERYDVAIVGGGHNGLVAAAYLARAGRSCVVLERRTELGGAVASAAPFDGVDVRLSRYSYLVSLLPELIVRELGLPLRLVRRRVASYTPDPRADAARGLLIDNEDAQATSDSLAAVTRGGRAGLASWHDHRERMHRLAQAVFPTLTQPLESRAQMRERVGDEALWDALFEQPLGEGLLPSLGDELLAGLVATDALIGTFASLSDLQLRQNRCFLYHVIGRGTGEWLVPAGGMGAVAGALAEAARGAGAELCARCEVLAIAPERDRVAVAMTDGAAQRTLHAGDVLVNAAPRELERLLAGAGAAQVVGAGAAQVVGAEADGVEAEADGVEAAGASGAARAREVTQPLPEGSQLKVNLVLSRLPRLRDSSVSPQSAFTGTFHANQTTAQLQRAYEQACAGEIPSLPPCEAYCHSLTDPGVLGPRLRAAGAQAMTVFVLHMPARLFERDPDGARRSALQATFASLDSVLGEPLDGCVLRTPHGEPCIELHSPLDLQRELRMPGGHIFHRDLSWPFAEREEETGKWGVETADARVLLCGAGARRGGGVSGVPGRNAAMALLGTS